MNDQSEPHEHPKPEYRPEFAEPPSEAYDRGVRDGILWVCTEARRRADPGWYKAEIALNRLRQALAQARTDLAKVEAAHAYCNYRDDMGR